MNRDYWLKCTACPLHESRRQVVLGSGDIPCDLLFIGEAPGKSEDLRGVPFCGPAGAIKRKAIERCVTLGATLPRMYTTNVVACRPTDAEGGNRTPTSVEIDCCRPRLQDEYLEVKPKVVIFLGETAYTSTQRMIPWGTKLRHPSYINRKGGVSSPEFVSFVRSLMEVFEWLNKQ